MLRDYYLVVKNSWKLEIKLFSYWTISHESLVYNSSVISDWTLGSWIQYELLRLF